MKQIAIAFSLLVVVPSVQASVLIDDFMAGPESASVEYGQPGPDLIQSNLSLDHVATGQRELTYNVIKAFQSSPATGATVDMTVDTTGEGTFRYDADADLSAANFSLIYTTATSTTIPDTFLNLSADGDTALAIDFDHANFAPGQGFIGVDLHSWTNGTSRGQYSFTSVQNSSSPFTLIIPFHDDFNDFDPSSVYRIEVGSANGYLFGSFAITSIHTVPEPSAVEALAGVAGMLLMCGRRRGATR
jgi:hypothetical protein